MDVGRQSHDRVMRSIELFGTRVAPAVRQAIGTGAAAAVTPDTVTSGVGPAARRRTETRHVSSGAARPERPHSRPAGVLTASRGSVPPGVAGILTPAG